MSETQRIAGTPSPAGIDAASRIVEDAQPWRINPFGRLDTREIADTLAEMRLSDPAAAARVEAEVRTRLSPSELSHLDQDLASAQGRADRRLILDATQIGIDLVGIVDPTGAADVACAGLSTARGDYAGAAISLIGLIPYAGDAAKLAKFGRWSDTVLSVARRAADSAEFAERAMPILRRIGDAIDALPQGVLDRMPASARARLDEMKTAIEATVRRSDDLMNSVSARALFANADFASEARFLGHFAKHGAEFPGLDAPGYLARARELLSTDSPSVLEKVRDNGDVLRFDTATGDFAVGTADGAIRTLFKPDAGRAYFDRQ